MYCKSEFNIDKKLYSHISGISDSTTYRHHSTNTTQHNIT